MSPNLIAIAAGTGGMVVILLTGALIFRYLAGYLGTFPEPRNPVGTDLEPRLAALEVKVAGLPSLWEEERQRAFKAADRARKAEARAEEILASVEGIEEPGLELFGGNGEGGDSAPVQPVQAGLASSDVPSVPEHIRLAAQQGYDPFTLATMGP